MKDLVIFYSFEGSTRLVAETIAKELGADILELKPIEEIKSHGFMKFLWGGKQVMQQKKPPLEKLNKSPEDYDTVFIGTPVWAFTYAPVFNTFFAENKINNKKIGLFCCNDGNKGKTFENMKKQLEGNEFLGEMEFSRTSKNKEGAVIKAKEWIKTLVP